MKKKCLVFLFLLSVLFIFTGISHAEYVWHEYGGHQYALTSTWERWEDASSEAESVGGYLASIGSGAENIWLTVTFQNTFAQGYTNNPVGAAAWIGYYLDRAEWKWTSGEPVIYTSHASGFPLDGGTHGYLHLLPHPDPYKWNNNPPHDGSDSSLWFKGIIERTSAVPIPAAVWLLGSGVIGLLGVRRMSKKPWGYIQHPSI
jgi:hypothetical protein